MTVLAGRPRARYRIPEGIRLSAGPARVDTVSTALYRRYRPESFGDVIGQEHVTEPLMQALRTGRVGHAYLFSGPRGCGKTTSARILARCLNCVQGPTPTPCGECDSCVALARGGAGSVDVIEIDAASHGGVDDARDLRERASYGPAQSRFKVYIIDEAHMVTPQGFNALLKVVEEPPEHVKFVFATTEPEKVIGTIRSRTHHYPFRLVPPAKLTGYLAQLCEHEGVAVAPGVLGFVIRAGGGSVRDSLSVLDQLIAGSGADGLTYEGAAALLGFTSVELLDATIDALAARDAAGVFAQVDKVIESGQDPRRFALDLLERLRDLIIVAAVPDAAQVLRGVPEDQLERMRGQQSGFGPGELSRAADIVNTGVTEMTGATAPRLQLELICARLLLPAASGEQGYAARLDRLERRLELGTPAAAPAAAPASGSADPAPAYAPEPDRAVPVPPHARTGSAAAEPVSRPAPDPAPAALAGQSGHGVRPGGSVPSDLDVTELRRAWPNVLGRIFTRRRATWTFLSQHAQVLDYDGQRLVLGIATTGLANAFRQGNHPEVVRQALIAEIGIDVRVEGVPAPAAGGAGSASSPDPAASAAPAAGPALPPSTPADPVQRSGPAFVGPSSPETGGSAPGPGVDSPSGPVRSGPAERSAASPEPLPPEPGWLDEPPPDDELPPDDDLPPPPPRAVPRVPGDSPAAAPEQPAHQAPSPGPLEARDAQARLDDEDVDAGAELGQTVIERVLGARVIEEIEE